RFYAKCMRVVFFISRFCAHRVLHFSLHDALPISRSSSCRRPARKQSAREIRNPSTVWRRLRLQCPRPSIGEDRQCTRAQRDRVRSEEHTSELQSRGHLVCRLLLEKKKQTKDRDNE